MLDSTESQVFNAALALPPDLRAELAMKLQDSLNSDSDLATRAKSLQQHFHAAKRVALNRENESPPAASELNSAKRE